MKIHFSLLAAVAGLALLQPSARAESAVSVDFFYDNLEPYGDWREVGEYGYAWQPRGVDRDWSPYSDGRWVDTDAGWAWDSEDPYGWAVYHYGRWANVDEVGWIWVPGTEWAPAWVSWRHNSNHVGWAPLPPEARFTVSVGFNGWVDDYYDIGPGNYRFVESRNFGERNLNTVFIDRSQNISIINETTNITNITYNNKVINNRGPNYDEMARQSNKRIDRYKLDRRQDFDRDGNGRDAKDMKSRIDGDTYRVAAPEFNDGPAKNKPGKLAKKVSNVEVNRGWKNAGSPEEITKARAKIQSEAKVPKELPQKARFEKRQGNTEPTVEPKAEPKEKGKNKRNDGDAVPSPSGQEAQTMPPKTEEPRDGKPMNSGRPQAREEEPEKILKPGNRKRLSRQEASEPQRETVKEPVARPKVSNPEREANPDRDANRNPDRNREDANPGGKQKRMEQARPQRQAQEPAARNPERKRPDFQQTPQRMRPEAQQPKVRQAQPRQQPRQEQRNPAKANPNKQGQGKKAPATSASPEEEEKGKKGKGRNRGQNAD